MAIWEMLGKQALQDQLTFLLAKNQEMSRQANCMAMISGRGTPYAGSLVHPFRKTVRWEPISQGEKGSACQARKSMAFGEGMLWGSASAPGLGCTVLNAGSDCEKELSTSLHRLPACLVLAVLAPWDIRSQNPFFSKNGCPKEPAHNVAPGGMIPQSSLVCISAIPVS